MLASIAEGSVRRAPLVPTYPISPHGKLRQGLLNGSRAGPVSDIQDLKSARDALMEELAHLRQALDDLEANSRTVKSQANTFTSTRREPALDLYSTSTKGLSHKDHSVNKAGVFDDEETEGIALSDHAIACLMQQSYDEEDAYLALQLQQLSFVGRFQCKICFDDCSEEDVAEVEACGHQMCRDCVKGHVASQLEARAYPIMCPLCAADKELSDPSVISHELIEQLGLSEVDYAILIELEMSQFSAAITCRGCNDSFLVDRDQLAQEKLVKCPWPKCRKVCCKTCNQVIDDPEAEHTCDGTAELKRIVDSNKWKFCPGCNTPAEKISGCNHITCPSPGCNVHFCYFCGATIIKSKVSKDITQAKIAHYQACTILDAIPDVDVPP